MTRQKPWVLFLLAKNRLLKRLGRLRLRLKRYSRVVIDRSTFLKTKADPKFINAIQLARIINSIRSAQRNYLRIADNVRFSNTKDRLEQFLILSSVTYEALDSFTKLNKYLKNLRTWTKHRDKIRYLNKEKGNGGSRYNKVLKPIRNQVVFHLEASAISKAIA